MDHDLGNAKIIWRLVVLFLFILPCHVLSADKVGPIIWSGFGLDKTGPVTWDGYAVVEDTSNLSGGIRTGSVYTLAGQLAATIDTAAMHWWSGGKFKFGVLGIGQNHTQYLYTGAIQTPSSMTAQPEVKIANLAYEQEINDKTKIRFGIMDIDDHFNQTGVAKDLLNTSFNNTVSMAYSSLLATYPFPGIGSEIEYTNNDWILQAAVYQGNPKNQGSVFHRGFFALGEAIYHIPTTSKAARYTIKLGVWNYYQPLRFISFTNHGIYAIGEINWDSNFGPHFGFAIQGGANVYKQLSVPYSAAACLSVSRIFTCRPHDSINFAMGRAWILYQNLNIETYYELSYAIHIYDNVRVIPDIQYFVKPTGIYPNAWVALVRLEYDI